MDISGILSSLGSVIRTIGISDIIDVALISVFVFYVLTMLIETKAMQLVRIAVFIFVGYIVATQFQLRTVAFLIESLMQVAFIAALVVFQPELRKAVEQLGSNNILNLNFLRKRTLEEVEADRLQKSIVAICDGIERMSEKQTGALIVMEKFSNLDRIRDTGIQLNSDITPELLGTIFYGGSPLHDGAVIVCDGRITTAGCVLPLSTDMEISKEMGTRHRAALGISEVSDAIALVVSEETGIISYARKGKLVRNKDRQALYNMLYNEFIVPVLESGDENIARSILGRKGKKNEKR